MKALLVGCVVTSQCVCLEAGGAFSTLLLLSPPDVSHPGLSPPGVSPPGVSLPDLSPPGLYTPGLSWFGVSGHHAIRLGGPHRGNSSSMGACADVTSPLCSLQT